MGSLIEIVYLLRQGKLRNPKSLLFGLQHNPNLANSACKILTSVAGPLGQQLRRAISWQVCDSGPDSLGSIQGILFEG